MICAVGKSTAYQLGNLDVKATWLVKTLISLCRCETLLAGKCWFFQFCSTIKSFSHNIFQALYFIMYERTITPYKVFDMFSTLLYSLGKKLPFDIK